MANRKVKVTQAYIDILKRDKEKLQKTLTETELDLEKHRAFNISLLKTAISVHGKDAQVSEAWLIEKLAKHFNNVKSWYWG